MIDFNPQELVAVRNLIDKEIGNLTLQIQDKEKNRPIFFLINDLTVLASAKGKLECEQNAQCAKAKSSK